MLLQQAPHRRNLLRNAHAGEANDARMWKPTHEDQLTEVLVLGDEDPSLRECQGEEFIVRSMRCYINGR